MTDGIHCMQCGELITRPTVPDRARIYCTEHEQQYWLAVANLGAVEALAWEGEFSRQEATMKHRLHQTMGALPFTWPRSTELDGALAVLAQYVTGGR